MNRRDALALALTLLALACGSSACGRDPCEELACRLWECSGASCDTESFPHDPCVQNTCAECFIDSGKDVCTELQEIAAECETACS
jgi:hypothetical protein